MDSKLNWNNKKLNIPCIGDEVTVNHGSHGQVEGTVVGYRSMQYADQPTGPATGRFLCIVVKLSGGSEVAFTPNEILAVTPAAYRIKRVAYTSLPDTTNKWGHWYVARVVEGEDGHTPVWYHGSKEDAVAAALQRNEAIGRSEEDALAISLSSLAVSSKHRRLQHLMDKLLYSLDGVDDKAFLEDDEVRGVIQEAAEENGIYSHLSMFEGKVLA